MFYFHSESNLQSRISRLLFNAIKLRSFTTLRRINAYIKNIHPLAHFKFALFSTVKRAYMSKIRTHIYTCFEKNMIMVAVYIMGT